jgi:hypothetical protein
MEYFVHECGVMLSAAVFQAERSIWRGSSTLHARSLVPLVKARDFGMTPPLCGTL